MKVLYSVVLLVTILHFIAAQSDQTFPGPCPIAPVVTNFSAPQFAGQWFEIRRYINTLIKDDCGTANYAWSSNQYNVSYATRNGNISSTLRLNLRPTWGQNYTSGRFDVYVNNTMERIPHYVIDTDYGTYAVVWGCRYAANSNTQRLFVYGRQPTLNNAVLNRINSTLSSYRIDYGKLRNTLQDNRRCGRTGSGSGGNNGKGSAESLHGKFQKILISIPTLLISFMLSFH